MPPQKEEGAWQHEDDSPTSKQQQGQQQHAHDHLSMEQLDPYQSGPRSSVLMRESFIMEFATSKGPPQIVFLCMLLALGFGSTIGVVPAVMTDRYARLNHGYSDERDCADYAMGEKPQECLDGSADAQYAVAIEAMISNGFTFLTSSLIGSLSDEYGRKGILVFGVALSTLSPLCLVLLQIRPEMSPIWYYGVGASRGLVSWIAVALSALSDVMQPKWRAPSFGLLLAGFSLGFALAPTLALFMSHFHVSVLSLCVLVLGLVNTIAFFPETLAPHSALIARMNREAQVEGLTAKEKIWWNIKRPLWELSILNRNRLFRLLSLLAFFSGVVSSGDQTLLIYYLEERIGFDDRDIAMLFLMMGVLGILVQGVFLKILNDAIGERLVITFCFVLGSIHNIMYGLAKDKATIFLAVGISAFVGMSFPTISAIKSNNVNESEQGRIQGALYSLSALASGAGPIVMRTIYKYTKDGAFLGPGSMFVVAGLIMLIAVACAYALPIDQANSRKPEDLPIMEALQSDHQRLPSSPSSNTPLL